MSLRWVKRGNYSSFPSREEKVDGIEASSFITNACEEIMAHLEVLSTWFDRHFDGKMETSEEWIMNPQSLNLD